jgi:hypothetical protein
MNNDQVPVKIDEKSYLSIGLILALLGGALRVESIASRSTDNKEQISKLEKKIEILEQINTRLSRIEGALGVKTEEK